MSERFVLEDTQERVNREPLLNILPVELFQSTAACELFIQLHLASIQSCWTTFFYVEKPDRGLAQNKHANQCESWYSILMKKKKDTELERW